MKTLKQAKMALLVMLAAFSILPGCGKKDNGPATNVAGVGYSPIGFVGGQPGVGGQCATITYNGAQTVLTFAGQLYGGTGLQANLSVAGVGTNTGGYPSMYNRTNSFGDSINIYVSGNSAYAVVSLAPATVAAVVQPYNSGNGSTGTVCGLYINASVLSGTMSGSGWTGNFGGGTIALTRNNQWIVNQYGQILQL